MKVDRLEFKKVVNDAAHLRFNYSQMRIADDSADIREDEIEYLIDNNIHHHVMNNSKRSLFGDKVNINSTVEKDYLLLKKYTEYFR